jgi:hypothetical protein
MIEGKNSFRIYGWPPGPAQARRPARPREVTRGSGDDGRGSEVDGSAILDCVTADRADGINCADLTGRAGTWTRSHVVAESGVTVTSHQCTH